MNRAQAVRSRASARRKANRLPRGYAGTLLAMFYGLAIAVLVVAAGVGALVTEGIKADTATAGGAADAASGAQPSAPSPPASPAASPAQISITATHLGDLRVGIEARVTMNAQKRPLGQAKVEASLDMTEMPGSHAQGPLTLRPGKQPGVYTTVATVPMLGKYEIRVQMHEPVQAEVSKVVSVGVVGPGG